MDVLAQKAAKLQPAPPPILLDDDLPGRVPFIPGEVDLRVTDVRDGGAEGAVVVQRSGHVDGVHEAVVVGEVPFNKRVLTCRRGKGEQRGTKGKRVITWEVARHSVSDGV